MKLNRSFIISYIRSLVVSAVGVTLIMKYILKRETLSLGSMAAFLFAISVLIFIGHFAREKRKEIMKKNS